MGLSRFAGSSSLIDRAFTLLVRQCAKLTEPNTFVGDERRHDASRLPHVCAQDMQDRKSETHVFPASRSNK